jgi:hypothetical protein
MARASAVIGLTMLGAAGAGAATIPFMGSSSVGMRCDSHRFPTVQACEAAGHTVCRPDGTTFVPASCTTGSGSSGRWYNSHPIYWFGGGRGGPTTSSPTHSGPSTVTTTTRSGGSGGPSTSTGGGTSSRGGFGSSATGHGTGSS